MLYSASLLRNNLLPSNRVIFISAEPEKSLSGRKSITESASCTVGNVALNSNIFSSKLNVPVGEIVGLALGDVTGFAEGEVEGIAVGLTI